MTKFVLLNWYVTYIKEISKNILLSTGTRKTLTETPQEEHLLLTGS